VTTALAIAKPRPLAIVVGYVAIFFGVLPFVLLKIGGRVDELLELEPSLPNVMPLGLPLTAAGLAFMAWSMLSLSMRGRGLPISHLPPTQLVARGPYAWMRHPIYVGYASAFAGIALLSGSIGRAVFSTLLLTIGSVLYATISEEPRLERRFGAAYRSYAAEVPAFPWPRALVLVLWRVGVGPLFERVANQVVMFRIGPTVWVSYGAFASAGAFAGLSLTHLLLRRFVTLDLELIYFATIGISVLLGARIVALFYQARLLLTSPGEALRRVGFVSWGGYLAFFIVPFLFFENAWWLIDRSVPGALVCSAIGRLGCLAYGCCYGRCASEGIRWHHPDAKPNRERRGENTPNPPEPRIPTQLLSSLSALVLAGVALALLRISPTRGTPTILVAIVYCFLRFGVEQLRDEVRFVGSSLTRGQIWCAVGAIVWIAMLFLVRPSSRLEALSTSSSFYGFVIAGAVAAIVFVTCSLHVRKVGRW